MKKCPFCAEEIQEDALKCKHCGEFLRPKEKEKWYFKNSILILLFLSVGPLALPLLWLKPGVSKRSKIIWTAVILLITYYSIAVTASAVKNIAAYYKQMSLY